MKTHKKLYIPSYGPVVAPVKQGFRWLLDTAAREHSQQTYMAVPVLQNLDGIISESLGRDLINQLKRDRSMPISYQRANFNLVLLTDRINPYSPDKGPALVLYPNARLLEKLDDRYQVTDMLVIPWIMKDIEDWKQTWNAQILGNENSQPNELAFSDPVVEEALKSLTNTVNLSTGLGHPLDRDAAIWLFRRLKKAQIYYNPIEIKTWLVHHGWSSSHAEDVRDVAEKIQGGRRLRTHSKGQRWVKDIVRIWREEASKR